MLNKMYNNLMGYLEGIYDDIEYFSDGLRDMALITNNTKSVLIVNADDIVEVYYKFEEDFDLYDAQLVQSYKRDSLASLEVVRFLG